MHNISKIFRKIIFFVLILITFSYEQAYAFNSVLLMDPDFMEFAVLTVPLTASVLMGLIESILTYKWLKPKETPFIYYLYQYFFSCFVAILLSIIVLSILFFAVGEVMTNTDSDVVLNTGVYYFMVLFVYIGWDQRRKDIEKMWDDEERKYVPIKNMVFLTTCLSYGLLYSYYYFKII